jgi:DNA polymerase-3 subunit gamma/tau
VPPAPVPRTPPPTVSDLPPMSPDDETIPPEEDVEYGQGVVSGPELIMRELGATVIQEIDHNR